MSSPLERLPAWRRWALAALGAAWLVALVLGFAALTRYAGTPGRAASPPLSFPPSRDVQPAPGRATLVMLVHSGCACSRASLRELERLLTRAGDTLRAHVVISGPDEGVASLERMVVEMGALAHRDRAGEGARRFGAYTSGNVVVYDASDALVFHGGITAARGHEGDSEGALAILTRLRGDAASKRTAPVFGCGLREGDEP